ncbi:MAG: hypothetical protein A3F84_22105 [Candidatus Handelsmanbacteria bacterium RIFCSPLOWO2_12_FULL_64_10]|uniref:LPS export ABC transporter permease LptG n=1 Tax=Handelsmanbacteria sp. (strain RIFCSPLOWO2_12_FULL_64_10) TaxID=1817868 RepID=A0A1F6CRL7_HANXR|nr:MAG: hypothetical protein A3F84_22105 [Candidatus Handelsmanbacteria bacterium RIFCSPLOWO2_12_FULL_64_10]
MGTLNRHVFKELIVSVTFWFLVLTAVVMSFVIMQLFRNLASQGLLFVLAQSPMMLGYVCPHTLAIAAALAVTMVMGRIAADREIDAMRTSGIPQSRILDPVLLAALLVAGGAALLHLQVTPAAYRHKKRLEREAVLAVLKRPPPGEQTIGLGRQYLLRYRGVVDGNVLQNPFIVEINVQKRAARAYYIATTARVDMGDPEVPKLILQKCSYGTMRSTDDEGVVREEEGTIGELTKSLDGLVPSEGEASDDLDGLRLWQLWDFAHVTSHPQRKRDAVTRFHGRVAGTIAPFALVLLAAGIGMTVQRSSRLVGLGATLPSLMVYYGMQQLGTSLSETGTLAPYLGPYLASAVMAISALGVIYFRCRR